jgi:hypothetical protein
VLRGSAQLREQADVDALAGCERIAGDLTLSTFAGAALAPLLSLTTVDGLLEIVGGAGESADAAALNGFAALQQVGALRLLRVQR